MSSKSAITLRGLTVDWPDGSVALSGVNGTFTTGRTGLVAATASASAAGEGVRVR